MSKYNTETAFVLGIRSTTSTGEKKLFILKNPRKSKLVLVDSDSPRKFKWFGTYRTAFRLIKKIADMNIEGLRGLEVVKVPRPMSKFQPVDSFLG